MKNLKQHLPAIAAFSLLAALAVFGITVAAVHSHGHKNTPVVLNPVEVTQYRGEKLSPISKVYDNAIRGTQHLNVSTYRLKIDGLVEHPVTETYGQVINHHQKYKKVVTLRCVEGWQAKILWEGVLVRDVIRDAGVDPRAKVVIFHASDGYTTSLPLSYFEKNDILIAYKMNGVTIPQSKGFPFQLVAESLWGYKWIKWITRIQLSDNVNYFGYWEERGYPNDGVILK
jgi:DMSO/TMAO reductase YedYZ molybdopterin-dependent catalytic subunit